MFDCIIVGAGPGGTTTAYHLAKQGYSVLVLEKSTLPRYKPCGGGVSPSIAPWFDFDFAPVIEQKITKVQYTWKMGDPVQSDLKLAEPMWIVRRDAFDYFLMQQAQQQGADLKDGTEVTEIDFDERQWQITTNRGVFTASYLVAADGAKGSLAKWLGFKPRPEFLGATLEIPQAIPSEEQDRAYFDLGTLKNGYIWHFPKVDGSTISAGCLRGKIKPQDVKKAVLNYAAHWGLDTENSTYYDYSLGLWTENIPLHTRHALLVGEAAAVSDPLTGEGIRPSIFTGIKAAEAIAAALQGDTGALENYTQVIQEEWGKDMALASRLAGLFYQFPKIAYKVGVKRPTASQVMSQLLCGELRYSDITDYAIQKIKQSFIPGRG